MLIKAAVYTGAVVFGLYAVHSSLNTTKQMEYALLDFLIKEAYPKKKKLGEYFSFERIVDGDCQGKVISIGMAPCGNSLCDGIRIGFDSQIKRLISQSAGPDGALIFNFEGDIQLIFHKGLMNDTIYYTLVTPELRVQKPFTNGYKTIVTANSEFDKITELK